MQGSLSMQKGGFFFSQRRQKLNGQNSQLKVELGNLDLPVSFSPLRLGLEAWHTSMISSHSPPVTHIGPALPERNLRGRSAFCSDCVRLSRGHAYCGPTWVLSSLGLLTQSVTTGCWFKPELNSLRGLESRAEIVVLADSRGESLL